MASPPTPAEAREMMMKYQRVCLAAAGQVAPALRLDPARSQRLLETEQFKPLLARLPRRENYTPE